MHRTLSGWEYYVLLKEAQALKGNRLSKAYQTGRRQFRLDFGKFSLIAGIGEYFYLSQNPPPAPESPSQFAMIIRKEIGGKFLDSFKQHKNDRIYVLEFSNGRRLVLEQFAQGNMFLLDENGLILRSYSYAPTSKKKYEIGEKYEYPDAGEANMLLSQEDWRKFACKNAQKSAGSALGRLSFGKIYISNLLEKLGIGRDLPLSQISAQQAQQIMSALSLMQKSPQFLIVEKGGRKELSLVPLEGAKICEKFNSFSEAIEHFAAIGAGPSREAKSPALIKLERRLCEQAGALGRADKAIEELLLAASCIEKNMEEADERLSAARKKGEKKVLLG